MPSFTLPEYPTTPSCWPHEPSRDGFCDKCRPNPGPWHWSDTDLNGECMDLSDGKGQDVIAIGRGYEGDDWLVVSEVNRARIAAVPELLRIARWVAFSHDAMDNYQPPRELVDLAKSIMEKLKKAANG